MRGQELYKTDLERHLYAVEPERRPAKRRGLRWMASVLGMVSGFGLAYWLYRRTGAARPRRTREFPEDDGSELAA